ncbi:MAG TPA: type II CAAX endopeptidase family protein, partial [Chthonomonadaceae bacterium]|nr:type II CAAX endopeptidase family protein [Chthonomonadaceae bacterium]
PNDWRRLGITLFLFGRPGGFSAFERAFAPAPPARPASAARLPGELARLIWAAGSPPTPDQERALWRAIYGPRPLLPQQAQALRPLLARLNLGWFERIAEARLYARAGMRADALRMAESAGGSAKALAQLSGVVDLLAFLGLPLLVIVVLARVVYRYSETPPGSAVPTGPLPASAAPSEALPVFSYRARMVGFITYLGLMVFLRIPTLLLRHLAQRLPPLAVARLDVALNLMVLPLLAYAAIWALRRAAAAETPDGRPPGQRITLAALGYRARNLLAAAVSGMLGYAMVAPVTLAAAMLSAWIFRRVHTPVHPIQVLEMALQTPLDHLLLLLEAAMIAPFVEETMFRGLLYPALRARWGVTGGVMASAAIFALLHPTLPGQFLPLWVLGIALALAYEWCGSLLPGILMHSLQNTFATLESFLTYAR